MIGSARAFAIAVWPLLVLAGPVCSQVPVPPVVKPVSGPWEGGSFTFTSHEAKTRKSLSGIACTARDGTSSVCLVAFDEGVEARFVTLTANGYVVDNEAVVLRQSDEELDAEAASADGKFYYVAGSHSAKRNSCKTNPGSRHLIRFLIDPATGKAKREAGGLAGYADDAGALWKLMGDLPELRDYVGPAMCLGTEPPPEAPGLLGRRGVNIEGIVAAQGKLFFGFRGPAQDGKVPVLSVAAGALFDGTDAQASVVMLEIGQGRGIRDLTSVGKEILVLAGPDDDNKNAGLSWTVSRWDGRSAAPRVIAVLDLSSVALRGCDKELKPEAIAVVASDAGRLDFVIMSDGMCDGGPLKFSLTEAKP